MHGYQRDRKERCAEVGQLVIMIVIGILHRDFINLIIFVDSMPYHQATENCKNSFFRRQRITLLVIIVLS